jgi:hypothetical protein
MAGHERPNLPTLATKKHIDAGCRAGTDGFIPKPMHPDARPPSPSWNRRDFLRAGALAAAACLAPARAAAAGKNAPAPALAPRDEILKRIAGARPLRGGPVPADLARRLGTAHVSGRYHFTDKPFLIEGAERVLSLGLGCVKFWFASIGRAYRFNSEWNLPESYTYKQLAEHPYFARALDLPFNAIALELYPAKLLDTPGAGVDFLAPGADFSEDERQTRELAQHLLAKYKDRDVTFLLQNWEGDWMFRGAARKEWARGEYPQLERRAEGFAGWFAARQRGVEQARAAAPGARCKVFHAVEVNRVFDALKNIPTITTHVLPAIRPDYISWSCYDGLKTESRSAEKTAAGLWQGLDIIQRHARTTQRDFEGKPAVYIGEIGFPEEVVPAPAVVKMMDGAMAVMFARRIPYIFHWELYCNERKDGRRFPVEKPETAADLRGFWLVRPDGSTGHTGEYFRKLLANAGGGGDKMQ